MTAKLFLCNITLRGALKRIRWIKRLKRNDYVHVFIKFNKKFFKPTSGTELNMLLQLFFKHFLSTLQIVFRQLTASQIIRCWKSKSAEAFIACTRTKILQLSLSLALNFYPRLPIILLPIWTAKMEYWVISSFSSLTEQRSV